MTSTVSPIAISLFFLVILATLSITYRAAQRSRTATELYAAGGRIKAWQNGWAIAGDLLSASTLLGGIGIFFRRATTRFFMSFPR